MVYTSIYSSKTSSNISALTHGATLNTTFTKHCSTASPLDVPGYAGTTLTSAYLYTFNDCIELCAAFNFWANDTVCGYAMYKAQAARPGNCWVGWTNIVSAELDGASPGLLEPMVETDIALLTT